MSEFHVSCYCILARKAELGISAFGVSITTMEEVFMKVGEGTDEALDARCVPHTTYHVDSGSKSNSLSAVIIAHTFQHK